MRDLFSDLAHLHLIENTVITYKIKCNPTYAWLTHTLCFSLSLIFCSFSNAYLYLQYFSVP